MSRNRSRLPRQCITTAEADRQFDQNELAAAVAESIATTEAADLEHAIRESELIMSRCFMCPALTRSPLRLRNPICLHVACSLHCLVLLETAWAGIETELRLMEAELPRDEKTDKG